jgi:hypothetical protein
MTTADTPVMLEGAITHMVTKATDPRATSHEAMQFSQAALNLAHALHVTKTAANIHE